MPDVIVRSLQRLDYLPCWQAMKTFTETRSGDTADELWVLEHPPVFTLGQAGKPEHVLAPGQIPVVQCDRGGQVTYHGPGQTVLYLLMDLNRLGLGSREMVSRIERALIETLGHFGVVSAADPDAPGVYVKGAKIASLGLRIRKGRSYHGLSLNRDPELEVFRRINPCGHIGQPVTSLAQLGVAATADAVDTVLVDRLLANFGWAECTRTTELPRWYNAPDPEQVEAP